LPGPCTNTGARTAGIDQVTATWIESRIGVGEFLGQVRNSLKSGEFTPVEVRQVMIPKGTSGKFRKLGIPTIADRVVQASLKAVLEPIFEADFEPCSYGFRPNRRAHDAIAEIHYLGTRGYEWVLEADIAACFDEISHTAVMERLRARIKDKRICALVKAFLKSGVFTELGRQEETLTGTPQGGILSPCSLTSPYRRWTNISTSTGTNTWAPRGNGASVDATAREITDSSATRMISS
jgi:RNA-directed DNA polymerase